MSARFDVVVIGSGAGGAPVACRLAQAGRKVLLIERGRAYKKEEFDRDEIEWSRRDRLIPSPKTDPHTKRTDEGQRATRTSEGWISTVLGGGTVHFSAFLLRACEADTRQGTRVKGEQGQSALDWAVPFVDFSRFYDAAEKDLGIAGAHGSGLPPLGSHAVADKIDAAAKKVGLTSTLTPRGQLTVARPEDDRLPCAYRQQCGSFGCPNDAKASMPATYIRAAQKTGNLTVWTETFAKRLVLDSETKQAKGVVVVKGGAEGGGAEEEVAASCFVVACGAIESARLLLLSGEGFNAQGQVGKNLWFSLFVELSGFFDKEKHKDIADLMTGSPFVNRSIAVDRTLPPELQKALKVDRTGMFQTSWSHDNPIHRAEQLASVGRGGKLLWGKELKTALQKEFRGGRRLILEGFGEQLPHPGMYTDLDPEVKDARGLPVARMTLWHHGRDARIAKQMVADGTALLEAMGVEDLRVHTTLGETMVLQGGTCRFGDDPTTSVTNRDGALHGVKNVYVSDGGSLPSSLTVPPTLTIVANSLRIAERIAALHK